MSLYCLKCRKNTESKNPKIVKTKDSRIMPYQDFNYLTRRAVSDKILHYEAFNIAKNPKYDGYQKGLLL